MEENNNINNINTNINSANINQITDVKMRNRELVDAILNFETDTALDIIKANQYDPNINVDSYMIKRKNGIKNKDNLLILAINQGLVEVSKQLILNKDNPININYTNLNMETALHYAVKADTLELVKLLIKEGCDTGIIDIFGDTPLILALKQNNQYFAIEILSSPTCRPYSLIKIIEFGKKTNSLKDEYTPLMYAIKNSMPAVASLLIKTGLSNPSFQSQITGSTALIFACLYSNYNIAIELLNIDKILARLQELGKIQKDIPAEVMQKNIDININAVDNKKNTALNYITNLSIQHDKFSVKDPIYGKIVFDMVKKMGRQFNVPNENGETPFMNMCEIGRYLYQITKYASDNFGDAIDYSATNKNGFTALIYSISSDIYDIANLIIDKGNYNPSQVSNKFNLTALHCAVIKNNPAATNIALKIIQTSGINCQPFNYDIYREPLIVCASRLNNIEVLKALLPFFTGENQYKINQENIFFNNAIAKAVVNNNIEIVRLLLNAGCNPYNVDINLHDCVTVANNMGHTDIVELIIGSRSRFSPEVINIPMDQMGIEIETGLEYKLGDWISLSPTNIVFAFKVKAKPGTTDFNNLKYFLLNISILSLDMSRKLNYICYRANMNSTDKNVVKKFSIYNGRSIGLYGYYSHTDIIEVLKKTAPEFDNPYKPFANKVFYIKETLTEDVVACASKNFIDNEQEYMRRRMNIPPLCTPGKEGQLYRIFLAEPDTTNFVAREKSVIQKEAENRNLNDNTRKRSRNEKSDSSSEETSEDEKDDNKYIVIKLKDNVEYIFDITENTTIGDIKQMLKNKIIEETDNKSPIIKMLMLMGKLYTNDTPEINNIKITSIPNFINGATFTPVLISKQVTGGRKTKRNIKKQIKKTKRTKSKNKKIKNKK